MTTTGAIFFTAACLAWAPGAGFYNPIVVLIVYITCKMIIGVGSDMEDPFGHDESKMIIGVGSEMEDPFGHDESDLPLEKFCQEIHKQITAIDERAELITYDLARGPAAHNPAQAQSQRRSSCSTSTSPNSSSSDEESHV